MARLGGCLALFFLLLLPTVFSASFSDCFPQQKLSRFWESKQYLDSNPGIVRFWGSYIYQLSFDAPLQEAGTQNIALVDFAQISSAIPPGDGQRFFGASSLLSQSSDSLRQATEHQSRARTQALQIQNPLAVIEGTLAEIMKFIVLKIPFNPISPGDTGRIMEKSQQHGSIEYIFDYHNQLWGYYSHAVDAYEQSNAAALAVARLADEKLSALEFAGAGKMSYSGSAKEPYLRAVSLISASDFCSSAQSADSISIYFASSSQIPNVSSVGFASHINTVAGNTGSSSIQKMLLHYSSLSTAAFRMEGEFESAQSDASEKISNLQSELVSLGTERLDLIGDPDFVLPQAQGVSVGSGFSGLSSGYNEAKSRLLSAQSLYSQSFSLAKSRSKQDFLADSISGMKDAAIIASGARNGSVSVRQTAEAAVSTSRNLAINIISKVRAKSDDASLSFADAEKLNSARLLVARAEEELARGDSLRSLGERFQAYLQAVSYSSQALSVLESRLLAGQNPLPESGLQRLALLIDSAEKDGLDVSYEKERLASFRSLEAAASGTDILGAIRAAAAEDEKAIHLRLYQKYEFLEELHARAISLSGALMASSQEAQSLSSLSQFFPSGKLNTASSVGKLKQIQLQLNGILKAEEKAAPSFLSGVLSGNSIVHEIYQAPILGKATSYQVSIFTNNPTDASTGSVVSFKAKTLLPLYTTDFVSGDKIHAAYWGDGFSTIELSEVEPRQAFGFVFAKQDQPAQVTSRTDSCAIAYSDSASILREIRFGSQRALMELGIEEEVSAFTSPSEAKYLGKTFLLQNAYSESGTPVLTGTITNVRQGQNTLQLAYGVSNPFLFESSDRTVETLPSGAKKITYKVTVSDASIDCNAAEVRLSEPFGGVSAASVASLGGKKTTLLPIFTGIGTSQIRFSFAGLRKGETSEFTVSYQLFDTGTAISSALSQAEFVVQNYNRSSDADALSEARRLVSLNRTDDALALLSRMNADAEKLAYAYQERSQFDSAKEGADTLLSSGKNMRELMLSENLTDGASGLQSLLLALEGALKDSQKQSDSGDFAKAAPAIGKAAAIYQSGLSSLAFKSAASAESTYSKARKAQSETGAPDEKLVLAESDISESQRRYASGDLLGAIYLSFRAERTLAAAQKSLDDGASALALSAKDSAEKFASALPEVEQSLSKFSSAYSSLSSQSRRKLPLTPSQAQSKIDSAKSAMASSQKAARPDRAALAANQSLDSLLSLKDVLEQSLDSIRASSESSLSTAKAAYGEAKAKATDSDSKEISQIASELSSAEALYSDSLYADSLASSDRVIQAASLFVTSKSQGPLDSKTIALAGISAAFIAAAAYMVLRAGKGGKTEKKKEKLRREED